MAHFYLADDARADDWTSGTRIELTGAEAKHAVTVSRVRTGERLLIGDGVGSIATGLVVRADAGCLALEVESVQSVPAAPQRVLLAQALAKGDRDELAVQAATELGVDGVVPWAAARSISRWQGAKAQKGRDRWSAIVREASKQSIRAWLPRVAELSGTKDLAKMAQGCTMLLLEPTAERGIADVPFEPGRDIVLVVGPEGGIAPEELAVLIDAGATPVRLGPEILRTSTAGPAALAILNVALGRW